MKFSELSLFTLFLYILTFLLIFDMEAQQMTSAESLQHIIRMCEAVCKVPCSEYLLSLMNIDLKVGNLSMLALSEAMLVIFKLCVLTSQQICLM